MTDGEINPNEENQCPECRNSAPLSTWIFIEETFDGMVFKCPHCGEQMTVEQMDSVT